MNHTPYTRRAIIDRTDGHCHICGRKVCINNHGAATGRRGAWEVDHSRARARGGTDHGNNLLPACVRCNRDKSDSTTRTARRQAGTSRTPLSKAAKAKYRDELKTAGTVLGGIVGLAGGPITAVVCALLGSAIGNSIKPPKY